MPIANGNSTFSRNVTVYDSQGQKKPEKLKQFISMTQPEEGKPIIDLKSTFVSTNEDGETKTIKSVLTVTRDGDKYTVSMPDLSIFRDKDGKPLADKLGNGNLKLDRVTFSSTGETKDDNRAPEFIFEASSGEKYKITTTATGVSVQEVDAEGNAVGNPFVYSTGNTSAIDIEVQPETVESFLDTKNQTFIIDNAKKLPAYYIGLYASQMEIGQSKTVGSMTIAKFANPADPTKPVVVVKVDDKTYIYHEGSLRECDKYHLHGRTESAKGASIRWEKAELFITIDIGSNKTVRIPIKRNEDGTLTAESLALIEFFGANVENGTEKSSSEKEIPTGVNDEQGNATTYKFHKADKSTDSKQTYKYAVKGSGASVSEREAVGGDDRTPPPPEVETRTPPIKPEPFNIEEPEKPEPPEKIEVPERKYKPLKQKETPAPKEYKFKEAYEVGGQIAFFAGAFMALVCPILAPALAVGMGIAGTALGIGGLTLHTFADKIVFRSHIRKAKDKVTELELKEYQEGEEAENFAVQEIANANARNQVTYQQSMVDYYRGLTAPEGYLTKKMAHAESMLAYQREALDYTMATSFKGAYEAYKTNGRGLAEEPFTGNERNKSLQENPALQVQMAGELQSILDCQDDAERETLINTFMQNNFDGLTAEQTAEVREMFNPENRDKLVLFTSQLRETAQAQETVYEVQSEVTTAEENATKHNEQLDKATKKRDELKEAQTKEFKNFNLYQVRKFFSSSTLNAKQREEALKEYAPYIIAKLILEKNYNDNTIKEFLFKTFGALPEKEMLKLFEILQEEAFKFNENCERNFEEWAKNFEYYAPDYYTYNNRDLLREHRGNTKEFESLRTRFIEDIEDIREKDTKDFVDEFKKLIKKYKKELKKLGITDEDIKKLSSKKTTKEERDKIIDDIEKRITLNGTSLAGRVRKLINITHEYSAERAPQETTNEDEYQPVYADENESEME